MTRITAMNKTKKILAVLLASVSVFAIQPAASAKTEEWVDTQGTKFKGDPVDVYGPFVIFRSGKYTGRRALLSMLSTADCVRVAELLKARPALSPDWSASKSPLAQDLKGSVNLLRDNKLVPENIASRREPRFIIVVWGNHGEGKSWQTLDAAMNAQKVITPAFPGMVEWVYAAVKHGEKDHIAMAKAKQLPFLITEHSSQSSMTRLQAFAPVDQGWGVTVLTADGVPLFQDSPENEEKMKAFFDSVIGFFQLGLPENPRGWKDRLHYVSAVRKAAHQKDSCPPELVGHVLSVEALKRNGATALKATLKVSPTGEVTTVDLDPAGVPEKLRAPIANALRQSAVAPAVDRGQFVEGALTLELPF